MTELPDDMGGLDDQIGAAMLDAATRAVVDAELYALARKCDPEPPDPASAADDESALSLLRLLRR